MATSLAQTSLTSCCLATCGGRNALGTPILSWRGGKRGRNPCFNQATWVSWVAIALTDHLVDVGQRNRGDAVQRLAEVGAVAADEDAAVVAEDAVVAGAAGDPVGA